MSSQAKLAFGVEFELLLKPKPTMLPTLEQRCSQWAEKLENAKAAVKAAEGKGHAEEQKAKEHAELIRKHFRSEIASILTALFDIPTVVSNSDTRVWSVVDEVALDEIPEYCKISLSAHT